MISLPSTGDGSFHSFVGMGSGVGMDPPVSSGVEEKSGGRVCSVV